MNDITNSVRKSLSIVKKRIKGDGGDDPDFLELYNELSTMNNSLIIRKQLEKRLVNFDFSKDADLVAAAWAH
jgi:hypothetical protein